MTPTTRKSGFALISTLSIMLLVVLLLVAMLTLASNTTRAQANGKDLAEAQANAKLALRLAIGDLQKQMGPDQRISANGSILSETAVLHPHWTGVWDSWKAGVGENSQHSTIGTGGEMAPSYATNRSDHFRRWLLSLDPSDLDPNTELNATLPTRLALEGKIIPGKNDTAIRLVGEGSLGGATTSQEDYVNARLLSITDSANSGKIAGRYGWWVGDESQKARIMYDTYDLDSSSLTTAEKIFRTQAPASMSNKTTPGLESIIDEQQLDKLPSYKTLDLVGLNTPPANGAPRVSELNFHDATIYSQGILADVREGGLKRDLNTLLERPILLNENSDEFMLYRFDAKGEDRVPLQDLAAYYQLYQNDPNWTSGKRGGIVHNAAASRVMQVNVPDLGNNTSRDKFTREYTSLYQSPVPVRVQFVLGVGATLITDAERAAINARQTAAGRLELRATDRYKLLLGVKPVVSLWNPNNTPLVMGVPGNAAATIAASQIMKVGFPPFALRWKKYRTDGAPAEYQSVHLNLNYAISNESTGDGRARSLGPYIMQLQFARNSPIVFQPGEVKMFSIPISDTNFLETGGN